MPASPRHAPKRRSVVRFQDEESVTKKTRRSITPENEENNCRPTSPESLIHNLDDILNSVLDPKDFPETVAIELKGFDATTATVEEYLKKREQISNMLADSDFFDKKTELNLGEATIASAKLEVDKRVTTRRMSRKLHNECGINESDILYKGLDVRKPEGVASKEVRDSRQASIIESCVDFQKQIQWKMNVMEHVQANTEKSKKFFPMSDGPSLRTRGGQDRKREENKKLQKEIKEHEQVKRGKKKKEFDSLKTPQKKVEFNALDERRIIENYALEVASEVRENSVKNRRQIAPIPFDINILDDEPDSDDERNQGMEID